MTPATRRATTLGLFAAAIASVTATALTARATDAQPPAAHPHAPTVPTPATGDSLWDSRGCNDDVRGQWFRDAKFGAFIHFGLYSELGGYWQGKGPYDPAEQIMGLGDRHMVIPVDEYRKTVGGAFNPAKFNAKEWVGLIKKAGQKYVIVTTKHHDGFCMFRTATTSYNVVDSTPFARDPIKELADECRRQGIAFCLYYSIGDWCAAAVKDPKYATYKDYMFAQLKEILTNYGDVKMLWLDNYWFVDNQWRNDPSHARELYDYVRSVSPNVLVNDRCGRGAASSDGDYATPENQLVGSRSSRYFEVVMTDTDDDNWGWVKTATNYRKPAELIKNLIDCVSKGGNFVLNVGPTADGEFPAQHVAIIEAMGRWTSINGEAIYGAVPAPEVHFPERGPLRAYATKSKDSKSVYVHIIDWPADNETAAVRIDRPGLAKAEMLDHALGQAPCAITAESNATTLTLKRPAKADPCATVIKLTFESAEATGTSPAR